MHAQCGKMRLSLSDVCSKKSYTSLLYKRHAVRCSGSVRPQTVGSRAAVAAVVVAAAGAAAATADGRESPAHDAQKEENKIDVTLDRKSKRKPSSAEPATIVRTAPAACAGPLPDVLAATFPDTFPTLSAARRVIRKDLLLVDGQLGSCKTEVATGQQLQQLEPVSKHKAPRTVQLQVLYEDDDVAVVHKPWGVKMYGGDSRRTVTGALKGGALSQSSQPDALTEPKPLHRLDAAVGGVLLVAKTSTAAAHISQQFVERRVHKVYHALLCGRLEPGAAILAEEQQQLWSGNSQPDLQQQRQEDQFEPGQASSTSTDDQLEQSSTEEELDDGDSTAQLPLEELLERQLQGAPAFTSRLDTADSEVLQESPAYTAVAAAAADGINSADSISSSEAADTVALPGRDFHVLDLPLQGKPCYSLYQVLGYSRSSRYGGWVTSVALSPVTGRKHQLRQHMAALGCPILGDGKYSINKDEHISNQGIYLESLEITFQHPRTHKRVHVVMPEPPRFGTMRQQLHNRWRKLSREASLSDELDDSKM